MTVEMNRGDGQVELQKRKPPGIVGDDRVFLAWHRTHMASERTFLAWCRTSIALIVFGFVIERLESTQPTHGGLGVSPEPGTSANPEMVYPALLSFVLAAGAILDPDFVFFS
ncbi:YidH family protein [Thermodesulfobacteriota bacterium]